VLDAEMPADAVEQLGWGDWRRNHGEPVEGRMRSGDQVGKEERRAETARGRAEVRKPERGQYSPRKKKRERLVNLVRLQRVCSALPSGVASNYRMETTQRPHDPGGGGAGGFPGDS